MKMEYRSFCNKHYELNNIFVFWFTFDPLISLVSLCSIVSLRTRWSIISYSPWWALISLVAFISFQANWTFFPGSPLPPIIPVGPISPRSPFIPSFPFVPFSPVGKCAKYNDVEFSSKWLIHIDVIYSNILPYATKVLIMYNNHCIWHMV